MEDIKDGLYNICTKFINDNQICCPEAIEQCDWVIENAYNLIQEICDCVGYFEEDDPDDN